MPIVAGDIVSISVFGRVYGQRIIMTRNYQVNTATSGGDTRTQLQAIGNQYKSVGQVVEAYLGLMPEQYQGDVVRSQVIYPVRSSFVDVQMTNTGTIDTPEALNQSAAGITLQTPKAGRSQRATIHIGPLPVDSVQSGTLTAGYVTLLNTLGARFLTQLSTTGPGAVAMTPIIYHRNGDGPLQKSDPVTGYSVNDELRTMRRRVVGRGI